MVFKKIEFLQTGIVFRNLSNSYLLRTIICTVLSIFVGSSVIAKTYIQNFRVFIPESAIPKLNETQNQKFLFESDKDKKDPKQYMEEKNSKGNL